MNVPRIISSLEYLDADLLEEAIAVQERKVLFHRPSFMRNWSRLSIAAACLCCILFLGGCTVFALMKMDVLPVIDSSDVPHVEIEYGNKGQWSETEAFDVFGSFTPDENISEKSNVDISKDLKLKKGKSKTWTLDIDGGWFGTAQDTVVVEIFNNSNLMFRYICEDVTDNKELANSSSTEGINRILSNLNPEHEYEITIINLGASQLNLEVRITSYHSENAEIIVK